MTSQTRATNKARFEEGDTPGGTAYVDLIDSFLSLADTSAQTITSPVVLSDTLGVGAKVSATTVSATNGGFNTITVSATATANTLHVKTLIMNAEVTAAVSAATSAARYFQVRVSGVNYWMPLYAQ